MPLDPVMLAFLQRIAPQAPQAPVQQSPAMTMPNLLPLADPGGTTPWLRQWGNSQGAPPDAGGGGNAPGASPDASGAPNLNLASMTLGPVDAAIQGGRQAMDAVSLSNAVSQFTGAPKAGVFSGNFTLPGLMSTLQNQGLNALTNTIPGFNTMQGLTNAVAGPLGALGGLMTFLGQNGQQTTSELSGPIGEGFGVTGINAPHADATSPTGFSIRGPDGSLSPYGGPDLTVNMDNTVTGPVGITGVRGGVDTEGPPGGNNPSGPSGPSGTGPSGAGAGTPGTGPPGGGVAGNGEAEDRGGLIGRKQRPAADAQGHVTIKALPTEYVVNPEATAQHGALLEAINAGADEDHLRRLLGNRAMRKPEAVTTAAPQGRALMARA